MKHSVGEANHLSLRSEQELGYNFVVWEEEWQIGLDSGWGHDLEHYCSEDAVEDVRIMIFNAEVVVQMK